MDALLTAFFERVDACGLTPERPTAAVDATGLESRHTSSYFVDRKGYQPFYRRDWPKLTVVCETHTYLWPGATVTRGPSNDSPQFPDAIRDAASRMDFDRVLADAAYDGEHNHRLCRDELGIPSTVIPLNPRRSANQLPKTKYRAQMYRRFPNRIYGQRWHVESSISQNKRRLGSALTARSDSTQHQECSLRVITHNLMILRRF